MRLDTVIKPPEEARAAQHADTIYRKWADLMATSGQFYWPSVGNSVAAYGQFFMAADTREGPEAVNYMNETPPRHARLCR